MTFTLRNLFVFVFASCAYLATLRGAVETCYDNDVPVLRLIGAWILLGFVYVSWSLRKALIVHLVGPIAVGVTGWISLVVDGLAISGGPAEFVVTLFAVGCAVSAFFSFPTATLAILAIAARRRQKASETATPDVR